MLTCSSLRKWLHVGADQSFERLASTQTLAPRARKSNTSPNTTRGAVRLQS